MTMTQQPAGAAGQPTGQPTGMPRTVPVTSWAAAEQAAAVWVRWLGHGDARCTAGGADGGLDVVSASAAAQVKHTGAAVTRPVMQCLLGADEGRGRTLYFFATGGYTQQALEYGDRVGIACFVLSRDGGIRAVNNTARMAYGRGVLAHRGQGWVDPVETAAVEAWVDAWANRIGVIFLIIGFVVAATFNPDSLGPNLLLGTAVGCVGYWLADRCLAWLLR